MAPPPAPVLAEASRAPSTATSVASASRPFVLVPDTLPSATDDILSFTTASRQPVVAAKQQSGGVASSEIQTFSTVAATKAGAPARVEKPVPAVTEHEYEVLEDSEDDRDARALGGDHSLQSAARHSSSNRDPGLPSLATHSDSNSRPLTELTGHSEPSIAIGASSSTGKPTVDARGVGTSAEAGVESVGAESDKAAATSKTVKTKPKMASSKNFEVLITSKPTSSKRKSSVTTSAFKSSEQVHSSDDDSIPAAPLPPTEPSRRRTRSASIASNHTDYETQPGMVVPPPKRTASKKRAVASSSEDEQEATETLDLSASTPPAPVKALTTKRPKVKAVSEDEDGQLALKAEIDRINEEASEADSDWGGGRRKSSKGRKNSKKGKKPPKTKKASPKPPPRSKRARTKESTEPLASLEPSTSASLPPGASVQSPRAQSRPSPRPSGPSSSKTNPTTTEASQVQAPSKTATSKRKNPIVHDSEEDEEETAVVPPPVVDDDASIASASPALSLKGKGKASATKRTTSTASNKKTKRPRVAASSDADDDQDSDGSSVIHTDDELSSPPRPPKGKKTASKSKASQTAQGSAPATGSKSRRTSVEDKIKEVMKAASEEAADPNMFGVSARKGDGDGQKASTSGKKPQHESDEDDEDEATRAADAQKTKENNPIKPASAGTPAPLAAAKRAGSVKPSTSASKPRGLAAVIAKTGLPGFKPQGMSRGKIPRLHVNMKPAPPPKKALPKEKVKKKKGDESYSDEEKPWWKTKDPEEWDDEDHRKWQIHQRKVEMGLDSD